MIFNYLKVGFRNILKYKIFSFINVFGLAAAMSVCMLIILMLADQKSYDQFNIKKNQVYRILCDKPDYRHPYATSPYPLEGVLKTTDPVIEDATHLVQGIGGDAVYEHHSVEMRGYFTDPSFFNVFSFELQKGDKEEALRSPNSMVISADIARRLFSDENPIGKTIAFSDRQLSGYVGQDGEGSAAVPWGHFTITGVIDSKNYKSHLKFDVLVSASSMQALLDTNKITNITGDWNNLFNCFTYALVKPGKTEKDLNASLSTLIAPYYANNKEMKGFKMTGQKLTTISPGILLGNEPNIVLPRIVYYFLSILALVIMLSACLNYTNLSIARSLTRAKEIGIRKVNGARRNNIILQFLSESVLTALFAGIMASLFLLFIRSAFLHLWVNRYLGFDLQGGITVYLSFVGFAMLIGLISGIYPALYLSGFQPVKALRNFANMRAGRLGIRKVLSVFQFVVSLVFIISAILIFNQSTHFLKFHFEFNSKNVVNVNLQGNAYRGVLSELSSVPGVENASACDYIPVSGRNEGIGLKRANRISSDTAGGRDNSGSKDEYKGASILKINNQFIDNLDLKIIAGQNFPAADTSGHFILVNEAFVKSFGYKYPSDIIGQAFLLPGNDSSGLIVAGVINNFHMNLDHDQIEPLVLQNRPSAFKYVNLRLSPGNPRQTLAALERKWKTIDPIHSFKYRFFDEQLASTSQGFFDIVSILGFMAVIAVCIACLGMLGMATYTTERRVKEVGIRKALGADNFGIVLLLSKAFVRILLIAILIAAPLSYLLNNLWLSKFPNRVDFGFETIFLGSMVLLTLGLLTIGSQTLHAARRNPVNALRIE